MDSTEPHCCCCSLAASKETVIVNSFVEPKMDYWGVAGNFVFLFHNCCCVDYHNSYCIYVAEISEAAEMDDFAGPHWRQQEPWRRKIDRCELLRDFTIF